MQSTVAAWVFCQYRFWAENTVNFGFHRRSSVLNVEGSGTHSEVQIFDADLIAKRSEVIGYGIDARRQRFPAETPFVYKPFRDQGLVYQWNDDARASLHDYNALDVSI